MLAYSYVHVSSCVNTFFRLNDCYTFFVCTLPTHQHLCEVCRLFCQILKNVDCIFVYHEEK